MKYILVLFLLLTGCSNFAPPFDPVLNEKLAEIKANAMDLKRECSLENLTDDTVHQKLTIPAMIVVNMEIYRDKNLKIATIDIWKELTNFEILVQKQNLNVKNPHISPAYCKDKLNDVIITVNAIMKPLGGL